MAQFARAYIEERVLYVCIGRLVDGVGWFFYGCVRRLMSDDHEA
jgi:hypothetical protein